MQKSNTLILHEGMNALKDKLGLVDSEKFITLILRENFDYTELANPAKMDTDSG